MTPLIRRVVRLSRASPAIIGAANWFALALSGAMRLSEGINLRIAPPGQIFFHWPTQALRKLKLIIQFEGRCHEC